MISQPQLEVWAIELSNFFIRNFEYQLVTLNHEKSELWLVNGKRESQQVLLITTVPVKDLNHDEIMNHRNALAMMLHTKPEGLTLSVYPDLEGSDEQQVVVSVGGVSSPAVSALFPGIVEELKVSTNVQIARTQAMNMLQRNIRRINNIRTRNKMHATLAIGGLAIIGFLLTLFLLGRGISLEATMIMLGAYYKPYLVKANEWWRLVTPMFLHYNLTHLLFNLLALRSMGSILERSLGKKKFLVILFSGVIAGNMFVFIKDEAILGMGMSAGIYALMGYMLVMLYEKNAYRDRRVLTEVLSTVFINILISTLPNVSFAAHFGGLYVGVFFGFIFSQRKDWQILRTASKVVLIASVGVMIFLMSSRMNAGISVFDIEVVNAWYELGFKGYASHLRHLILGIR